MADKLLVDYWMEPFLDVPGSTGQGKSRKVVVGIIYATKAGRWYRARDSSDPFEVIAEIGRIESLKQLGFQMTRKQVTYDFFREVYADQAEFTLSVWYELASYAAGGKRTLVKKMQVIYYESTLTDYAVDIGFEEGRIKFKEFLQVHYASAKP
jgi:hypothetical protein